MENLVITKENALKAYNAGCDDVKAVLSNLFGPQTFKSQIVLERVTTLEQACEELGIDFDDLFDNCEDDYEKAEVAIKTFAAALREGKPAKECFYYPYFLRSSGGGFSFYDCDCGLVLSCVGARLRVDTAKRLNTWAGAWRHTTRHT
ncbi:hypothetical protein [Paraflavitalea speifideaquila]|uniref:hypothetical protein n=1 Tax=Paraflavitalea speifideaquila TaxID=3076558 RepID=UPI0028E715A0|nr:hypothetical protein [Paraflavitalea speifideiaquila]